MHSAYQKWILNSYDMILTEYVHLDKLDQQVGDGDHGSTILKGMKVAKELFLSNLDYPIEESMAIISKQMRIEMGGASGILIQFPLYFGIMGIMKETGMIELMSDFFISISNENTFPIYTFFSAGLVNIFVPSGGGQWAIQGPIIVEAAMKLGVSIPKSVMSLAYGDQLTNMLQPFWALPLLGITGLKAKEILPYTLLLMLLGGMIFIGGLLIF